MHTQSTSHVKMMNLTELNNYFSSTESLKLASIV
uniref:Uncharacterized protein n=1 Tax=Schistosoma japonicum TaxID=6182 RepID=Q5C6G4_SCHJA|nr:unknown [Schistosoma japonicum]